MNLATLLFKLSFSIFFLFVYSINYNAVFEMVKYILCVSVEVLQKRG